jgi:hypothetical protein
MWIFAGLKKVLHQVLYPLILACCLLAAGCNMKVKYLPQIEAPYLAEIEFLKQVSHQEGDIKRIRFKNNKIKPDFYVYLKINNIENQGTVDIRFYRSTSRSFQEGLEILRNRLFSILVYPNGAGMISDRDILQTVQLLQRIARDTFSMISRSYLSPIILSAMQIRHSCFRQSGKLNFSFGEAGKYFEYIIFIDRMEKMKPGKYRYGVFLNNLLLTENKFVVHSRQ